MTPIFVLLARADDAVTVDVDITPLPSPPPPVIPSPSQSQSPAGWLAETGIEPTWLLVAAAVALVVVGVLVEWRRRRSHG